MKAPSQHPFPVSNILSQIQTYLILFSIIHILILYISLLFYLVAFSISILFPSPTISKDNQPWHQEKSFGSGFAKWKEKKSWFKETQAPVTPHVNTRSHSKWLPQPLHAKESPSRSQLLWQSGPYSIRGMSNSWWWTRLLEMKEEPAPC